MPEFNSRAGGSPRFTKAVLGARPSAAETNKLQDAVSRLYSQHAVFDRLIGIEIVRVDDAIGIFDVEGSIHSDYSQQSGRSEVGDQAGFVQYFDRDQYVWLENGEEQKSGIVDPMGLVWDADEVVPMFYHRQSAKYIPLSPRTVRHAVTWTDVNRGYPTTASTKYPIKFVRFEYQDIGGGLQTPTTVYLDSQSITPLTNDPDDYVLNINACAPGILFPVRTPLSIYNVIGKNGEQQWYTDTDAYSRLKGVVTAGAGIAAGGSGNVTVWENGALTARVETAYYDWLYDADLVYGQRVVMQYYPNDYGGTGRFCIELPWC